MKLTDPLTRTDLESVRDRRYYRSMVEREIFTPEEGRACLLDRWALLDFDGWYDKT